MFNIPKIFLQDVHFKELRKFLFFSRGIFSHMRNLDHVHPDKKKNFLDYKVALITDTELCNDILYRIRLLESKEKER